MFVVERQGGNMIDTTVAVTQTTNISTWQAILASQLTPMHILIGLGVGVVAYMLYLALSNPKLYEERFNIKSKYKKQLRGYMKDSMAVIHNKSVEGARNVIKQASLDKCITCGMDEADFQLNAYDTRLEIVLNQYLLDAIFAALYTNGWHSLDEQQREAYYESKGGLLYDNVVEHMYNYKRHFPYILDSSMERFKRDYAIKIFKDIVIFYSACEKNEAEELDKLSYRYNKFLQFVHWVTRHK